jgi:hypothetical protein
MIESGTQIINIKRNTIHIVDGVEVINNEKLVFTTDMKCFPIKEIELFYPFQFTNKDQDALKKLSISLFEVLENDYPYFDPPKVSKKNMFKTIWSKIKRSFTSSNG